MLAKMADLSQVQVLVTDSGASDAQLDQLRVTGLEVRVAQLPAQ